jgi:hypothetical protein
MAAYAGDRSRESEELRLALLVPGYGRTGTRRYVERPVAAECAVYSRSSGVLTRTSCRWRHGAVDRSGGQSPPTWPRRVA